MISIQEDTNLSAIVEGLALGANHYNEVEKKSEGIPYQPNLETFYELLKQNMLLVVSARDEEGKMVGYFLMLTAPDILTGSPSAQELGIFVSKKYRGGSTFVRMEKKMTSILKERGYKEMRIMFKTGHNTDIPLRMGYEETERIYQKLL